MLSIIVGYDEGFEFPCGSENGNPVLPDVDDDGDDEEREDSEDADAVDDEDIGETDEIVDGSVNNPVPEAADDTGELM